MSWTIKMIKFVCKPFCIYIKISLLLFLCHLLKSLFNFGIKEIVQKNELLMCETKIRNNIL